MNPLSLIEKLLEIGEIKASRKPSIQTAVKQYCRILGSEDILQCQPNIYNLPLGKVNKIIEENAAVHLSSHSVRNLKNNVSFLLRKGIERGLLTSPEMETLDWNTPYDLRNYEGQARREYTTTRLNCDLADSSFERELKLYEKWSTKPVNLDRPSSIKKRESSMKGIIANFNHVAKYLVLIKGIALSKLRLIDIIQLEYVGDYVNWWLGQHEERVTVTIHQTLIYLIVLAKHYFKEIEIANQIKNIRGNLGTPVAVVDKSKRWLSLREIEKAGKSWYPHNAKRLTSMKTRPSYQKNTSGRLYAFWVQRSLALRLLVRIPLRQRNFREMELNKNLVKRKDGWHIIFMGNELKIAQKKGKVHIVKHRFPSELEPLLEEWLDKWRPRLQPKSNLVFVNYNGNSFQLDTFKKIVTNGTYKFTGVAVTPHIIRDIWATEYIKDTHDFIGAAKRLGDNVETVLRHYAYLLDEEADATASNWITGKLSK